ncbi:MAG TPA: hypothetical protein VGV36_04210 [Solirubrobacteraceae bacterium]|nr:hypothetical protein [Solirubrobacteraceae bacterium]
MSEAIRGRPAVITGASSGIGEATARTLANCATAGATSSTSTQWLAGNQPL